MELALHQIDAFADAPFSGNPAAVMPLPHWLPDATLQRLAQENNLSETAFYIPDLPFEAGAAPDFPAYHLRWFTPQAEVDLCGHATLASAHHLFERVHPGARGLGFYTRSGWLHVDATEHGLLMDLPAEQPVEVEPNPALVAATGVTPVRALRATDEILVVDSAAEVRALAPDFASFPDLPRGVIVTAAADEDGVDFVSRFFAPAVGINEDPVTGSAHTQLTPLWAGELGRNELVARQLSARGGTLHCALRGERVDVLGACRRYLDGTVYLPDGADA